MCPAFSYENALAETVVRDSQPGRMRCRLQHRVGSIAGAVSESTLPVRAIGLCAVRGESACRTV